MTDLPNGNGFHLSIGDIVFALTPKALIHQQNTLNYMRRRAVLSSAAGISALAVSGCLSSDSGNTSGELDSDPPAIPDNFVCDRDPAELFPNLSEDELDEGEFTRLDLTDDLHLGEHGDWQLDINSQSFDYGDTAEIELSHSGSGGATGNEAVWVIEIFSESGWHDVRMVLFPHGGMRQLDALNHLEQTTFEWEIELTEVGIIDAYGHHAGAEAVCPELQTGRYRFVYPSFDDIQGGLGIEFDLFR